METLEKIKSALNKKTNKSWFIENNAIKMNGGQSELGTDYSITLEGEQIRVSVTGSSSVFSNLKSLIYGINDCIALDDATEEIDSWIGSPEN